MKRRQHSRKKKRKHRILRKNQIQNQRCDGFTAVMKRMAMI